MWAESADTTHTVQVQCSGGEEVQSSDDHIYSAREKLPRALQNKIKVCPYFTTTAIYGDACTNTEIPEETESILTRSPPPLFPDHCSQTTVL